MNLFVFDIETVPDLDGGRRLHGLEGLSDKDVANVMFNKRRQENGTEFLRLHLHRVVAISAVLRSSDRVKVWSLGDPDAGEAELIQRFYDGIDRFTPTLVSWNGGGFDLPVLHYRAMLHGISAPRYWETGEEDTSFRWNNYLSRYHTRHTDLMDLLAGYQARAYVPLDEMAGLLGFPGKMGMSGAKVWESFQAGEIGRIRDYCETDVLNTYLVYLRYQLFRGQLLESAHAAELRLLADSLAEENKPHLTAFLDAWRAADPFLRRAAAASA
jgi:predicted PolB exonuclease-like 3'-5' exonuclease